MDRFSIYYATLRDKNRALLRQREARCFAKEPLLLSLQQQRSSAFLLPREQAKAKLAELSQLKADTLRRMGLPEDYLDPIYSCKLCQDTGYVGEDIKRKCSCLLQLEQQDRLESGKINRRETFAAFDPAYYEDDSQRSWAIKVKKFLEDYAESLPKLQKPQLLFFGKPGLGKSFFGNAIAYRVLERGIDCRRVTAYHFINEVMEGLSQKNSPMPAYARLPFLVLDDIGSEPAIPNITVESLFALVDERRSAGLPTLYITNLNYNQLQEHYGERVSSRILDERVTSMIHFQGQCLRRERR